MFAYFFYLGVESVLPGEGLVFLGLFKISQFRINLLVIKSRHKLRSRHHKLLRHCSIFVESGSLSFARRQIHHLRVVTIGTLLKIEVNLAIDIFAGGATLFG